MPIQHYRTETFTARSSLGYLLKRAHADLSDALEDVVAAGGLTITQWVLLMHLRDGLAITAADLCAKLRHDSGALTRLLDQLESRGLIGRERSREDRRAVQLRLTDAGSQSVEALLPRVVERLNLVLHEFSRAEMTEFIRLLGKFIASVDGLSGESAEQRDRAAIASEAAS